MPTFSLLVPTWNNLAHLRLFVESLRRHSAREHELIVHANEGSDGTLEWLREQGIAHTASAQNLGICQAVNLAAARATGDYLLYFNDDMVVAPGWDTALDRGIARVARHGDFMLSGTMLASYVTPIYVQISKPVADYFRMPSRNQNSMLQPRYKQLQVCQKPLALEMPGHLIKYLNYTFGKMSAPKEVRNWKSQDQTSPARGKRTASRQHT